MAIYSSALAWRIPWTEEPGGLQSTGSIRARHDGSDLARMCTHVFTTLTTSKCAAQTHRAPMCVLPTVHLQNLNLLLSPHSPPSRPQPPAHFLCLWRPPLQGPPVGESDSIRSR